MSEAPVPRFDTEEELREKCLPLCRLKRGEVWEDPVHGHRVGVLDACSVPDMAALTTGVGARMAVSDPPYNLALGDKPSHGLFRTDIPTYIEFSRLWVKALLPCLLDDAHFYVWLGADQTAGFQPLPDFMIMMREIPELRPRSFITMRNQRGYGTGRNWMCVRQELLYYVRGNPDFSVLYTDIPKILRGYYKVVGGKRTENLERGGSDCIRPGNVWVDIQQVFYRMEENVPGAYAQKPLAAIRRIIESGSRPGDTIIDPFAHSGTTLVASELTGRRCFTSDIDPIFAEISIRRLECLRSSGRTGWQRSHPFPELDPALPLFST